MQEDSPYVLSLKTELSARMNERNMLLSDAEINYLDIIHLDRIIEEIKEMIWVEIN